MDPITIIYQIAIAFGTLIIGYYIGIRQSREIKSESTSEEKKQVIESLITEIVMNQEILKIGMKPARNVKGDTRMWFPRTLLNDSYQSIINSGKFILLSPELQAHVSLYYQEIEGFNNAVENSGAMLLPDVYQRSVKTIKAGINSIIKDSKEILIKLEAEKKVIP